MDGCFPTLIVFEIIPFDPKMQYNPVQYDSPYTAKYAYSRYFNVKNVEFWPYDPKTGRIFDKIPLIPKKEDPEKKSTIPNPSNNKPVDPQPNPEKNEKRIVSPSDAKQIPQIIQSMKAGETLFFKPGNYSWDHSLIIDKDIILSGIT